MSAQPIPKLADVSSHYGAPMGRRDTIPVLGKDGCDLVCECPRLRMVRLRFADGDYDSGGAYWGGSNGSYIYRAVGYGYELFVRAKSHSEAKTEVRKKVPGASFYN